MFYIITGFIILLDGLLTNVIPMYFNQISLFYPMLTIVYIVYIYNKVDSKKYFKIIFIIGIIYDLLYSYIFLYHALIFLLFGKMLKKINKYIRGNFLINCFIIVLFIIIYDTFLFILIKMTGYSNVNLSNLLYKVQNSLLLNLVAFLLFQVIFKNVSFSKK